MGTITEEDQNVCRTIEDQGYCSSYYQAVRVAADRPVDRTPRKNKKITVYPREFRTDRVPRAIEYSSRLFIYTFFCNPCSS